MKTSNPSRDRIYETIRVEFADRTVRIWLDRPDVRNAFNIRLVRELREAVAAAGKDEDVRAVVLSGSGTSFCAGADLNWMREIISQSYEENLKESLELSACLYELYALRKPTIARVNGPAVGGGVGFLAACDIVIASTAARFGLSEVKIGLVPAAISPYVVRRIGESRARRYFLTGERFDARRAEDIGLVSLVAEPDQLDAAVDSCLALLLTSGPEALIKVKDLLRTVPGLSFDDARLFTAEMIAGLRVSPEAQEGMAAFLEKRKPRWSA